MWRYLQLKNLCDVFTDGDWIETKDQSSDGIRLVQTGNVKVGCFADRGDKARYVSEETFKRLNCTEVKEGDILVSRLPEPVGRACIVPNLAEKLITAVDCTIVRTTTDMLPEYLNYYMQSPQYFSSVKDKVTGATRQRISRKNLGEINIFFPPPAEQQRIVAKLDAAFAEIDRAIEIAEAKEAEIDKLKASLLTASLKDDAVMWKTVRLGEALKTGAGGTPLKAKKEFYKDGNIKWLLSGAVCEKDIYRSQTFISQLGLENSSAKIFPENTVLVAMYGATAGQVGILRTEAATNQAVCGIYPNSYYLPEFLYYYLTNYKETLLLEVSGVAQPNLSQEKIKNIQIPLIPLAEQQRIVATLDAAFAEIDTAFSAVRSQRKNYSTLKSSILAQELQPSEAA